MHHFHFIAGDNLEKSDFQDMERFVESFPDFQTVALDNESQLELLLNLMGIDESKGINLESGEFSKYWDLSNWQFPSFDEVQFNVFYTDWLSKSNRENNMDEYGNLIFLRGLTLKWNLHKFRLVVLAR